jgi:hypothetical protein
VTEGTMIPANSESISLADQPESESLRNVI